MREWVGAIEDPKECLGLLLRITDTIYHAHLRGVVHRDIKPENIIMRYNQDSCAWEPFLTDFDLAWFSTASLQTKDALGTVFYAAPEQLGKPGSAGARSPLVDVYSIAQVFYYALTGSDPTPLDLADNVRSLRSQLGKWPVARPAELVVALYAECVDRRPDRRPKSMGEVSNRLYDALLAFHEYEKAPMSPDEFAREVRFAVVGLDNSSMDQHFVSPSRHSRVSIIWTSDKIRIQFILTRVPIV